MYLSENIKKYRGLLGISQIELAKELNVTKQCVSNWENDNVMPSIEMMLKIADYFNVTTDKLLGRSNKDAIDVSELTLEQRAHIRLIVSDFSRANKLLNSPD